LSHAGNQFPLAALIAFLPGAAAIWEFDMRKCSLVVAAVAGLGFAVSAASAAPLSAPLAAGAAVGGGAELVHCVPGIAHRHAWGWGTGCGRARVYVGPRWRHGWGRGYVGRHVYGGYRGGYRRHWR
jgi:hypothetical protein